MRRGTRAQIKRKDWSERSVGPPAIRHIYAYTLPMSAKSRPLPRPGSGQAAVGGTRKCDVKTQPSLHQGQEAEDALCFATGIPREQARSVNRFRV